MTTLDPSARSTGHRLARLAVYTGFIAAAAALGYIASEKFGHGYQAAATNADPAPLPWVAAAPGRVEPRSGEMKIGAGVLGRVVDVPVSVNDLVEPGELLVRLEDNEARARLAAAEADAGARKNERDSQPATAGREDVRKAEDAVFNAERAVTGARFELDAAIAAKRSGTNNAQTLTEARQRFATAQDRLKRDLAAFATAQLKTNIPAPNRFESALNAARANIAQAEALLDQTRIRAPAGGTVLQVYAKLGEMVSPSPEQPLVVIGDTSVMRVKAEVGEDDAGKIFVGQKAFVKSTGFAGKEFSGAVVALAASLAPPRIGLRGPRNPTDVEVMEVTIDLDGRVPLLPGMRVDAFFKREPASR